MALAPTQIKNQIPELASTKQFSDGCKPGETAMKPMRKITPEHVTLQGFDSPLFFIFEPVCEIRKWVMGGGFFLLPRGQVTVGCVDQPGMFIVVAIDA